MYPTTQPQKHSPFTDTVKMVSHTLQEEEHRTICHLPSFLAALHVKIKQMVGLLQTAHAESPKLEAMSKIIIKRNDSKRWSRQNLINSVIITDSALL